MTIPYSGTVISMERYNYLAIYRLLWNQNPRLMNHSAAFIAALCRLLNAVKAVGLLFSQTLGLGTLLDI